MAAIGLLTHKTLSTRHISHLMIVAFAAAGTATVIVGVEPGP
jgi:hypothetical protein